MTLRDETRRILSDGPMKREELKEALLKLGAKKDYIKGAINRMLKCKMIISDGVPLTPTYKLNKSYKAGKYNPSPNQVFSHCRKNSRILKYIDKPLQAVRA